MAKKANKTTKAGANETLVGDNRKARFDYEILDTFEAGIVLKGTEVKTLRQGHLTLGEAYAKFTGEELWLIGCNIPEYSHGNVQNHEPKRRRKLLLKKAELKKLKDQAQMKGLTMVPLRVYFGEKGYAKVTVGVGRGRKTQDKRQSLKHKQPNKEMRDR